MSSFNARSVNLAKRSCRSSSAARGDEAADEVVLDRRALVPKVEKDS